MPRSDRSDKRLYFQTWASTAPVMPAMPQLTRDEDDMVIVLGLIAAFLFGLGLVTQQHVASATPEQDRLSHRLLLDLVRRPLWLAGVIAMAGGQVFEALALDRGSLTVVEPLLATSLLFALPMAAFWSHQRPGASDYGGAVLLIVGLTTFMLSAGSGPLVHASVSSSDWLITGLAVAGAVALLVLFAKHTSLGEEATLLGAAAGILYGLQDAITQRTLFLSSDGVSAFFSDWKPYALVVVGLAGLWLNQSAFAAAPIQASLPSLTAAEPLAGIAIGVGVFDESFRLSLPYLAFEVCGLAIVVAGVFLVARSPIVTGYEAVKTIREAETSHRQTSSEGTTRWTVPVGETTTGTTRYPSIPTPTAEDDDGVDSSKGIQTP
jgi:drug/metabolite transporter (DMT)-like permease